jgi:hypothetical protein
VAQLVEELCYKQGGRGVSIGLTQPPLEMSTRNISRGQRRPVRKIDNFMTFMCQLS